MREGAEFFKTLLECNIPKIVVENPIPHKYALEIIGKKYDQIIQPWQFGHEESKATCLRLKNLPNLKPTKIMENRRNNLTPSGQNKIGPSPDRWKIRSTTYAGIAKAIASQYGGLIGKNN